jgi:hypothetical protein
MTISTAPPNGGSTASSVASTATFPDLVGDPDLFIVSTPDGLYSSDDVGKTWGDYP